MRRIRRSRALGLIAVHRAQLGICGIAFLLTAVLALAPNASAAPSGCTAHGSPQGGRGGRCNFTATSTTLTYTAKDPAGSSWSIFDLTTRTGLQAGSSSASGTLTVTQGDTIVVAIGGPGSIKATT